MPICTECGEEIIFRTLDGIRTPIHLNGGCRGYSYMSYGNSLRSATYTYKREDDFCRKTRCPECGEDVYFIRHNGGSFWVNELGWPWPKHACFDDTSTTQSFDRIKALLPQSSFFLLGRIIAIHNINQTTDKIIVTILEDGREGHFQVECRPGTEPLKDEIIIILNSSIVLSNGKKMSISDFMFHGEVLYKVFYLSPETGQKNKSNQSGSMDFGCPYCRSFFSNLDVATRHIYSKHKNMLVDITFKKRTQYWSLIRQKVTVRCLVCHEFFTKDQLKIHKSEVHQE